MGKAHRWQDHLHGLASSGLSATCVLPGLVALLPGIRKESALIGKMDSSARLAHQASRLWPVVNPSAVLSSKSLLASQLSLKQCFRWLAEVPYSLHIISMVPTCQNDASTLLDGPCSTTSETTRAPTQLNVSIFPRKGLIQSNL